MKAVKAIFIALFLAMVIVPVLCLNTEENAVSEIDNKVLAANPFSSPDGGDLTSSIETYLSERIGFRDEEILWYTVANDKLFGAMVHPTYAYGKEGYVFFKPGTNVAYGDYQEAFVHMLSQIQQYCRERDIAFVFLFEPSKASVLSEKLMAGYHYSNEWVSCFVQRLEEESVHYVDNTAVLRECRHQGIEVFNVKYNAGHWNDTGAFYGMNAALAALSEQGANVHINQLDEYRVDQRLNTTLLVSEFPINEYEPIYSLLHADAIESATKQYDGEVIRNDQYRAFGYCKNTARMEEGCDRALVFQGSYINGMGYKFLQNAFGEYISVHDYQNILNFQYYVNIFKPQCIIFDAAEYTFSSTYFDYDGMVDFTLPPPLAIYEEYAVCNIDAVVSAKAGEQLVTVTVSGLAFECDNGYMVSHGEEYELQKGTDDAGHSIYTLTIKRENYDSDAVFYMISDHEQIKYRIEPSFVN
ncbi:MAG: hypothetical protein J5482_02985 [Oscillospiraceae bacterium]|nr:hypothetical protein [Oscillospiraceae bacterium]